MHTKQLCLVFVWSVFTVKCVGPARILGIFPFPSISHQFVFRALTEGLAQRGHELVVLTTDPAYPKGKHPYNVTEIDVHDISYNIKSSTMGAVVDEVHPLVFLLMWRMIYKNLIMASAEAQLSSPKMQAIINNPQEKFDLIIYEEIFRPAMYFAHRFKAPLIAISSFGAQLHTMRSLGAPVHPTLYQEMSSSKAGSLNVFERTHELVAYLIMKFTCATFDNDDYEFGKKFFGDDVPSVEEMQKNIDLVFVSANPFWVGMRPLPPNVVTINGIHMKPPKDLPDDLRQFLDNSKHGVVYMSLGSNIKSSRDLPTDTVATILRVFEDLPYNVLWKWETDELPGKPDNVMLVKWLPQNDLLRHPNVKVFITQGGLQSVEETIAAGVPTVVIPFFGDQPLNAQKYELLGIGLKVDRRAITYDTLKGAINEVINNNTYKTSVVRLSKLVKDDPLTPLERALWWTEYVIRHQGARHLRSPAAAADVSSAEYYMLDVLALLSASLLAIFAGLYLAIRAVVKAAFVRKPKLKAK